MGLYSKTDVELKNAAIYHKLGLDLEIDRLECLSHVAKRMKTNLCKKQDAVLKAFELKMSTNKFLGKKGWARKRQQRNL